MFEVGSLKFKVQGSKVKVAWVARSTGEASVCLLSSVICPSNHRKVDWHFLTQRRRDAKYAEVF